MGWRVNGLGVELHAQHNINFRACAQNLPRGRRREGVVIEWLGC